MRVGLEFQVIEVYGSTVESERSGRAPTNRRNPSTRHDHCPSGSVRKTGAGSEM